MTENQTPAALPTLENPSLSAPFWVLPDEFVAEKALIEFPYLNQLSPKARECFINYGSVVPPFQFKIERYQLPTKDDFNEVFEDELQALRGHLCERLLDLLIDIHYNDDPIEKLLLSFGTDGLIKKIYQACTENAFKVITENATTLDPIILKPVKWLEHVLDGWPQYVLKEVNNYLDGGFLDDLFKANKKPLYVSKDELVETTRQHYNENVKPERERLQIACEYLEQAKESFQFEKERMRCIKSILGLDKVDELEQKIKNDALEHGVRFNSRYFDEVTTRFTLQYEEIAREFAMYKQEALEHRSRVNSQEDTSKAMEAKATESKSTNTSSQAAAMESKATDLKQTDTAPESTAKAPTKTKEKKSIKVNRSKVPNSFHPELSANAKILYGRLLVLTCYGAKECVYTNQTALEELHFNPRSTDRYFKELRDAKLLTTANTSKHPNALSINVRMVELNIEDLPPTKRTAL